jgi:hypothetical protein
MLRQQQPRLHKSGLSRVFRVQARCSERPVWFPAVLARLNGWFGENRCATEISVLRVQANAASAIAADAQVRIVRTAVTGQSSSEWQL